MTAPPEISGLSHGELVELVVKLLAKVAELERLVQQQREEIARLKGLKGRPYGIRWLGFNARTARIIFIAVQTETLPALAESGADR